MSTHWPSQGQAYPHESARAHVTGEALYVDDIPEVRGTLFAAPIMSPLAHGRLNRIDTQMALACPGVAGVVLAGDVPGSFMQGSVIHDEPIFADQVVEYQGQVVGLIVAKSPAQARAAARKVVLDVDPLPAITGIREALASEFFVLPPVFLKRGDASKALGQAPFRLSGEWSVGGQEHFYLEGQIAYALPQEQGQWHIFSSTQHPSEVQHWVAGALGLDFNAVKVECKRMGGGFGGKESQAGHLAVWAAVAAHKFRLPVKMRLDRDEDFKITGKRHPFEYRYTVGFDNTGRLCGLDLTMLVNCGYSADLSGPVADRALFHADNAYFLEDVSIASYRCKTHTQSHTAFRGFGGPQGMAIIEHVMGEVARHLSLDPLEVRQRNLYGPGRNRTHYGMDVEDNILAPLMEQLALSSQYTKRRHALHAWNASSTVVKRGIALTPLKFGISFTATLFNQAGAWVQVYLDGSIAVNHGGTEMGQGLHTKVAQIVADELGVPIDLVRMTATDTSKIPNTSATAASAGTDLNGRAAQFAARKVRERLAALVSELDGCDIREVVFQHGEIRSSATTRSFREVVQMAYARRIQLWSDGYYATPKIHYDRNTLTGRPFYYFAYGAACTEVAIDTLTGESRVLRVDILHDVGRSINPAVDLGQIEGGFIQGMGWLTTEELVWDVAGHLNTQGPSTYKIPSIGDLPPYFKVNFWPAPNPEANVFGSKAVGEPPFMLALSVIEALKDAVSQHNFKQSVSLKAPATPENVLRALNA
ncbi:MAG: xanthine dehydrogenase molybdopterin binding subunit [Betaproteobacteria bacterium]|nr:xanthine dehydrogenase molybdopterin binding subunit [Betaproteobacteria bacterium]